MSPGDGIRLKHHCHHLFHVSSYPNQLEDTKEYVKYLLQTHHIGECNEFIIGEKKLRLLRHHLFEAIRSGLVCPHDPITVIYNRVYHKIEDLGRQWDPWVTPWYLCKGSQ